MNAIPMIEPITGWFKIAQYDDKHKITLLKLVETTCLTK